MGSYAIFSIKLIISDDYNTQDKLITAALISGYVSLAVSNFFGFSTVVVGLIFFLFPGFMLLMTETEINEDEDEDVLVLDNFSSGMVFFLMVFSMFMTYKIYAVYLGDKAYASGKTAAAQENIQLSLQLFDKAIKYQKNEPVFMDEFSKVAANAAARHVLPVPPL